MSAWALAMPTNLPAGHDLPPRRPIGAVKSANRASALLRQREGSPASGSGSDEVPEFDAAERQLWAGRAEAFRDGFANSAPNTAPVLLDNVGARPGSSYSTSAPELAPSQQRRRALRAILQERLATHGGELGLGSRIRARFQGLEGDLDFPDRARDELVDPWRPS